MEKHIPILLMVIAIILGTINTVNLNSLHKKTNNSEMRSYFLFNLFLNLYIATIFIYQYILLNMFQNKLSGITQNPLLLSFIVLAIISFVVFFSYFFLKTVVGLAGKKMNRVWTSAFGILGLFSLLTFIYIFSQMIFFQRFNRFSAFLIWFITMITFNIITSTTMLLSIYRSRHKTRKSLIYFSSLYSISFLCFLYTLLDDLMIGSFLLPIAIPASLIILNIIPVVWIRKLYTSEFSNLPRSENSLESLQIIAADYKITNREKEVIAEIINGKSNKEIAAALSISLSTVKSYIYQIYQKLDVKSRTQLVHFINNFK